MSTILGVNPELWGSEWPTAVAAVESLTKNIVWTAYVDPTGGTNGSGGEICWTGATRNLSIIRPATVDYYIQGDNPLGFACAASLQLQWNGTPVTTSIQGTWNGTSTQEDQIADQWAISLFVTPWASLRAE